MFQDISLFKKSKIWQMGLQQTENLLHNKGNSQQREEMARELEKTSANSKLLKTGK